MSKCFRCGLELIKTDNFSNVSSKDEKLCKYCDEFDDDNGEMKEE